MSCVVTRHPGTILKIPGYQVWCYEFQGEHAAYETAELGRVRVSGAEEVSSTGCDSYMGQRRGEREANGNGKVSEMKSSREGKREIRN